MRKLWHINLIWTENLWKTLMCDTKCYDSVCNQEPVKQCLMLSFEYPEMKQFGMIISMAISLFQWPHCFQQFWLKDFYFITGYI